MSDKSTSILKKLGKGILAAATHWITRITIPAFLFTLLIGQTIEGVDLGYSQELVNEIVYYITAFGIVSAALTFFKSSTPKYSVRKAILEIVLLVVNASYFYTYKLSGAFDFENIEVFASAGLSISFMLNFDVMIYVSMATIGLNIFVAIYDLVISLVSPIEDGQSKSKNKKKMEDTGYVYAFDENLTNKNNKKSKKSNDKDEGTAAMEAYSF